MLLNFREEIPYTSLAPSNDNNRKSPLHRYATYLRQTWREATIICLSVLCAGLLLERILTSLDTIAEKSKGYEYRIASNDDRWVQFQWTTGIYSSEDPEDHDAVNSAWEAIVPAYGFVALDHSWAAKHHLPASMSLPSDRSKGVYIVDGYHQIHCLTIIRKTLHEIQSGRTPSIPLQHAWHCFDSLLQYIVCGTSGETLLYTWGRNQTGDGQLRRCVDWKSRKNWIRENTACYSDSEHPIPLYEHFTRCEGHEMEIGDGIVLQMW